MRRIGKGGWGEVWQARDQWLSRDVAIKLVLPHRLADSSLEAGKRFQREARFAAQLRNPHIVTVYAAGEADLEGGRVPFIVMELLQGRPFGEMLKERHQTLEDAAPLGEPDLLRAECRPRRRHGAPGPPELRRGKHKADCGRTIRGHARVHAARAVGGQGRGTQRPVRAGVPAVRDGHRISPVPGHQLERVLPPAHHAHPTS